MAGEMARIAAKSKKQRAKERQEYSKLRAQEHGIFSLAKWAAADGIIKKESGERPSACIVM